LRDCLSPWGSAGPFDANTANPALMEAMGVAPADVAALVARRQNAPFRSIAEAAELTPYVGRLTVGGGRTMWTLRATARLRRPDGMFSDVVRTASATVKLLDPRQFPTAPYPAVVLRWYDDAWTQGIIPPSDGITFATGNAGGSLP
jgi:hypothetical protein